jgi:signal transduction histidine kinase
MSSLELVQRVGNTDPEFRDRILADLRTDVSRMARMVTQLLIMARTGAATAGANRPVLLGDVLSDVCRQWSLQDTQLNFGWEVDEVEDAVVEANEDYLRQLFSILLDNAFKFTPIGGRIKVEGSQAGDDVRVTVSDTGVGISEKDLPQIFDRFYRASNGRSDGSGLGLAIARHIVDQYGGTIQADSVEGAGSSFTITLPRVTE